MAKLIKRTTVNSGPRADQGSVNAIGKVEPVPITREMETSYLDYAMSVIVSRALPDVRDGLKPVHRRILYAMWQMGLRSNAKFRKSAAIVGDVLGKYHPHGDTAVYDALVRMAQDFSMRDTLVAGQGNFGSMDGDAAAAMRYTESKLSALAEELLRDIEKETVPFIPNYDSTHEEPTVLPALVPNLLVNGTVGIAVGMATSIPPHNLGEICDALIHTIDHPNASVEDLLQFVKGPDFPTGGTIFDQSEITQAYATGRGSIVTRAKAEIVEEGRGTQIIVTEIPYAVNKATLLETIAHLVQEKKIEGIRDLRDESSKGEVRIVIDLKKDAYPKKVLNRLYHSTELQKTFHVNMLAIVDGIQPRILSLKGVFEEFLKHRREVIRRRTQYDLTRAKERAHILEGLQIAILHIDDIIATIKKSQDRDEARVNLIRKFHLTEPQTNAILDMRLSQLASLERIKVETELKDKLALIKELEAILKSDARIAGVIKEETRELREKFGSPRRTEVRLQGVKEFKQEDLIPNVPAIVMVTRDGYLKRVPPDTFKTQGRGGKGVIGLTTKEADVVDYLFATMTHADVLFFTTRGRCFQLKAYDIPDASRTAKGQALVNFLNLSPAEKMSAILPLSDLGKEEKYLVMATRQGVVKKVDIASFANVRRSGLIAIKLRGDDLLEYVKPSTGHDEVLLVSRQGQAILFKEKDVRPMGRVSAGVRGMKLTRANDAVVGMDVVGKSAAENSEVLVIMDRGYGKRTGLGQYRTQGRGGSGIKTAEVTDKTGSVTTAFVMNRKAPPEDLIVVSAKGQVIRLPYKQVSVLGRATQGVRVMRFKEEDDEVASVTYV
ncbi:DNA gyrase subunit A [Candidatus Uhrbacteria bacterium]|nr:DNA gyrase subunit A [Candidatus Uhrbacteria bacterium]